MSSDQDDMQDSLSTPSGSLKLNIKDNDYIIRIMRPSGSASLHELQRSLQRNREMLKESYEEMLESCRDEIIKKKKGANYISPTQNALVARANIDLLIPLINVRGGVASYKGKLEAMPIEKHVDKLRNKAVKTVENEISSNRMGSFGIIILVLIIATFFLYLFA